MEEKVNEENVQYYRRNSAKNNSNLTCDYDVDLCDIDIMMLTNPEILNPQSVAHCKHTLLS